MTLGLPTLAGNHLLEELKKNIPMRESHPLGICLVLDADRTLSLEDTGRLVGNSLGINDSIRQIFEQRGYLDEAFTEVSAIWSAVCRDVYVSELERVADGVQLRACWQVILGVIAERVPVIVVTAGIPQIWRKVLLNAGYSHIPVIGGCHMTLDNYAISARSKGDIVFALREMGWVVIAAGDSCVDLPMLMAADTALFVPDTKGSPALRSELVAVTSVRHLLVDEQRFDELCTCSAAEAAEMILQGGFWIVD